MDSADELIHFDTPNGVFWTRKHDFVNAQLRDLGGHQLSELGLMRSLSKEGDVILDVGAHIGTFCIPMAKHVGASGRVYAFEPTPESYRILNKNIEANGLETQALATNALISDREDDYSVHYPSDHTSAAYFVPLGESESSSKTPGDGSVDVSTIHLDSWGLSGETALERLDVLKVDTEGMELGVLRSASALIERFQPVIMAEISNAHLARAGDSARDVGKFLKKRGYRFYRNLRPRHAQNEDFEFARIWNPSHVTDLYDLVAIHRDSERHPSSARSPLPTFIRYFLARLKNLPGGIRRRLLG